MVHSSQKIQDEIISFFGSLPPFFEPALESPAVLDNLWQQMLTFNLRNPLPTRLKEKLSCLLSRYSLVPYSALCHPSTLYPLQLSAADILKLYKHPPPAFDRMPSDLKLLSQLSQGVWPDSDSHLEGILLMAAVVVFFDRDRSRTLDNLRQILIKETFMQKTQ